MIPHIDGVTPARKKLQVQTNLEEQARYEQCIRWPARPRHGVIQCSVYTYSRAWFNGGSNKLNERRTDPDTTMSAAIKTTWSRDACDFPLISLSASVGVKCKDPGA